MENKICKSCNYCVNYGAVFTEIDLYSDREYYCMKGKDIDPKIKSVSADFDRTIERDCCDLDFFACIDEDVELLEILADESISEDEAFDKAFGVFDKKYKSNENKM